MVKCHEKNWTHDSILSIPEDLKLLKMALKVMLAVCVWVVAVVWRSQSSVNRRLQDYSQRRDEKNSVLCCSFIVFLLSVCFHIYMQKVILTKFNNESIMMFDSNINYWNDISMLKLKFNVYSNHPLKVIPQTNISYKQRCFKSTVLSGTLLCKYYLGCTYQTDAIPSPNIFWLHRISMFWAQHLSNWCVSTQ